MKFFRTIFFFGVILTAVLMLWRAGESSVSTRVVPPLDEFIASSTSIGHSFSTPSTSSSSSEWLASSTIISVLLSSHSSSTNKTTTGDVATTSVLTRAAAASKTPVSTIGARSTLQDGYLNTPKGKIRLIIASNPTTRRMGLSDYDSLAPDRGMMFIFPRAESVGFWMKDMKFPIDIVWISANRKILGIDENISPETYPKMFISPGDVQFVLEINADAAAKFGLKKGMTLSF